jgi:hypothetical protein
MNKLTNFAYNAAFQANTVLANPAVAIAALAKRFERGDADSSGSTIRTGLVVALVIALLGVLAAAISGLGGRIAGRLNGVLP